MQETTTETTQTQVPEVPMPPMVLEDALPVYFTSSAVKVVMDGGAEKYLTYDQMASLLQASVRATSGTSVSVDALYLPSDTLCFGGDTTRKYLTCYYQSRVVDVTYLDITRPSVIPNIIIYHELIDRGGGDFSLADTKYLCTDLPPSRLNQGIIRGIDHSNRIFLMPFSNMYENGAMCYGNNTMPTRFTNNNLRGLDWYYQMLWVSPFNNDLGVIALNDRYSVRSWFDMLATCAAEGAPFPYDKLRGYTPRQ